MKKVKMQRKAVILLLICVMAVQLFSGCSSKNSEEKTAISIALWSDQLMEYYAPWLQKQFPDVEFDFYSATNSTDYYNYLASNDELPDIMTVRRFALKDVEGIKDELMDLSDTKVANNYYQSYLSNYTYSDGTVNWLPACAEVDDIIVNKTLFEEYNIEIPADYESFVTACEAFEKVGITGFVTDINFDYACMETLQGFSAGTLNSFEGLAWRQSYESGETNRLSEKVWLPVFEKMLDVVKVSGMNEETLELTSGSIGEAFADGKIAMYRGTAMYMELWGDDYEKIIIPYPGGTDEESYYLTYPAFQVAAKDTDDKEKEELILGILAAMLSEEGLNHIIPGQSMVAYNKNVELDLDESLSNMESYIEENRMYIRLASSDMFSVSQTVVHEMISGEITDAESALDEFNRILEENENPAEAKTVAHIDTAYSREFTKEHGNEAASALYNTIREEMDADIVIGSSGSVGCSIHEGDYTETELGYLLNWESVEPRQMELTGSELADYLEFLMNKDNTMDAACNDYTLPVISGAEMKLSRTDDGYQVEGLTINGTAIDEDKTYTVVSWDCYDTNYTDLLAEAGFDDYEMVDANMDALIYQRLVTEGGQLSEPTDYISIE